METLRTQVGRGLLALVCGFALAMSVPGHAQQSDAEKTLLANAQSLQARGRIDLAVQNWKQVLVSDPNNTEALAGLARAAMLAGNKDEAAQYLDRLRQVSPNDPRIAEIQQLKPGQSVSPDLQQAARLAEAGKNEEAMAYYRKQFGDNPPPGDWAIAYYETQAGIKSQIPQAIAGLRRMAREHPDDARYEIALGEILTYDPRQRAEGISILQRYPDDPHAQQALRKALSWNSANPATDAAIRAYLKNHTDAALQAQLAQNEARQSQSANYLARTSEERAAYQALSANHLGDAEQRFNALLAKDPKNWRALAGLGWVRMKQNNFAGAVDYFQQAQANGGKERVIADSLNTSHFWMTMQQGTAALDQNDLTVAEQKFREALKMRPMSPEAIDGLGGTLMKQQHPEQAAQLFEQYIRLQRNKPSGWKGLFMAQYQAGDPRAALNTMQRMPPAVRADLQHDPDYLRTLAAAYSATGQDAQAQRVLQAAVNMPFKNNGKGMKADTQMQYAALLMQAGRYQQAAELYQQVITANPSDPNAYQGLVRAQHAMGQDAQAIQTVEQMPPDAFTAAQRDPGFLQTLAAIYQSQNRLDVAQQFLEKANSATPGHPSVPVELQLAAIELQRGNSVQAYAIYQQVLNEDPNRADAWLGLLAALHATDRDREALAEQRSIPPNTLAKLNQDPHYLQIMASIYSGLGMNGQALATLNMVVMHYQSQNVGVPADVDLQYAWLLMNAGENARLYEVLVRLGNRSDLTDSQRSQLQNIWATWSVRRANQASDRGDTRRAVQILDAANRAFPGNPDVQKSLAGGYLKAGEAKRAEIIYQQMNWSAPTLQDYRGAIGAALAAKDMHQAEVWLQAALHQFPNDPQILVLAAKYEQARGDNPRAAAYYKASLDAMGPEEPSDTLVPDMHQAAPMAAQQPGTPTPDLMNLLAPGTDNGATRPQQLYNQAPSPVPMYGAVPNGAPVQVQPQMQQGMPQSQAPQTLGNYNPGQSSLRTNGLHVKGRDGLATVAQLAIEHAEGAQWFIKPQSASALPVVAMLEMPLMWQQGQQQTTDTPAPHMHLSMPKNAAVVNQQAAPAFVPAPAQAAPVAATTATTPATTVKPAATPVQQAAQPAAAQPAPTQTATQPHMHLRMPMQSSPAPAGTQTQSPVIEARATTPVPPPAAATAAPATAAAPARPAPAAVASQPKPEPAPYVAPVPARSAPAPVVASTATPAVVPVTPPETVETVPGLRYAPTAQTEQYHSAQYQSQAPAQQGNEPAPTAPSQIQEENQAAYAGNGGQPYAPPQPVYGAPINSSPYGGQQSLPPQTYSPPSGGGYSYYQDTQIPVQQQPDYYRRLPPLTGNYQSYVPQSNQFTAREQIQQQLEAIQGAYSPWLGGTAMVSYRSGTPGFDRLTVFSAPIEGSAVLNDAVRLTVIFAPAILDTGTPGATSTIYRQGTQPLGAPVYTQTASGTGGEVQLRTTNYGVSAGYTPYGFLVSNITGAVYARPAGGPFTIFLNRGPVTDTQLSYSGLRNQGTPFNQDIWGGVMANSGEIQFAQSTDRSGYYLQAGGQYITGTHVEDNWRVDGDMGAYWRVKTWPGVGTLTVGANMFGMHYEHNLRYFTYGQGGYFSPDAYLLGNVPLTFNGYSGRNFHYRIVSSIGVQAFQEDSSPYFPLDPSLQFPTPPPASPLYYPTRDSVSANYLIDIEASYRMSDHWFAGGFFNANNTRDYNSITAGFFVRYMFRSQYPTDDGGPPTGLFPYTGLRPILVP